MIERSRDLDEQARAFQEALAQRLAQLPYAQLCELPQRSDLKSPPELVGLLFAVNRHGPRRDRVWVEVIESAGGPTATTVAAMVREMETRYSVWFEKHADGRVVWPKPDASLG